MAPAKAASISAAAVALLAGMIAAISNGLLRVPLPAPAHGKYVHLVPKGVLPWTPHPLQGPFAPNMRLLQAERLFEGQIHGAESVAFDPAGNLVMVDKFGAVFQATQQQQHQHGGGSSSSPGGHGTWVFSPIPVGQLGMGRPLGFHYDAAGNLLVCDSLAGLVQLDAPAAGSSSRAPAVSVLSSRVSASSPLDPGSDVTYANDLALAHGPDGKVYFTSCSDVIPARHPDGYYDTFRAWMMGLAQGLPRGRLMMYDPATQETTVLAKGFYYANGVALSPDGSYLVVAETDRIRLMKHWLAGPKAGTTEPLLQHLPGAPDGVSTAPDGSGFWVALVSPVPPIAKLLRDPVVRALYAWLPGWARPPLKKWGAVVKVSGEGEVLDWLMDPDGHHVNTISAAVEHEGALYLGNLAGDYVSAVRLQQQS